MSSSDINARCAQRAQLPSLENRGQLSLYRGSQLTTHHRRPSSRLASSPSSGVARGFQPSLKQLRVKNRCLKSPMQILSVPCQHGIPLSVRLGFGACPGPRSVQRTTVTRPKQRSELGPEHDVSGCDSLIPRPQRLTGKVIGFHPSCGLSKPNQLCLKPPQLGGVRNLC